MVAPVFAANSVVIDQVGDGAIKVQQSGAENSAEIRQITKDPVAPPASTPAADYQKSVLDNPYTSPKARAEVLSEEQKAPPVKDTKKIIADAKKELAHEKRHDNNSVVQQTGAKNSVTSVQKGTDNNLTVNQRGADNHVQKTQSGERNHSHINENGDVVEDN